MIKEFFEGPVGDYGIARNTIKCLFKLVCHEATKLDLICFVFNIFFFEHYFNLYCIFFFKDTLFFH